jgi:hypothetical protein
MIILRGGATAAAADVAAGPARDRDRRRAARSAAEADPVNAATAARASTNFFISIPQPLSVEFDCP